MNVRSLETRNILFSVKATNRLSFLFSVFFARKLFPRRYDIFQLTRVAGSEKRRRRERKQTGSANAFRSLDPKRLHEIQSHRQMDRSAVKHTRGEARTAPLSNNRLFGFHYRRDAPKEHDPKVPITMCTHKATHAV